MTKEVLTGTFLLNDKTTNTVKTYKVEVSGVPEFTDLQRIRTDSVYRTDEERNIDHYKDLPVEVRINGRVVRGARYSIIRNWTFTNINNTQLVTWEIILTVTKNKHKWIVVGASSIDLAVKSEEHVLFEEMIEDFKEAMRDSSFGKKSGIYPVGKRFY